MKGTALNHANESGLMVVLDLDGKLDIAAMPGRPNRSTFRTAATAELPADGIPLEDFLNQIGSPAVRRAAVSVLRRFTSREIHEDALIWSLRELGIP